MLYTICHFLGVRRVEVSIGEPPHLVGLASGRVLPRRVIKCAGVVGAQVDDDGIRFPCSKIIFLLCAKGGIALPHSYTAHLRIVGRHHMAHIVVPAGHETPATLRDAAVFGSQCIGGQAAVVVLRREKGSHPVLLRLGSDGTLAAGDAVAHKLQPILRLRQGQKFAACIFQPGDLQQMRRVIVHGLHIL